MTFDLVYDLDLIRWRILIGWILQPDLCRGRRRFQHIVHLTVLEWKCVRVNVWGCEGGRGREMARVNEAAAQLQSPKVVMVPTCIINLGTLITKIHSCTNLYMY